MWIKVILPPTTCLFDCVCACWQEEMSHICQKYTTLKSQLAPGWVAFLHRGAVMCGNTADHINKIWKQHKQTQSILFFALVSDIQLWQQIKTWLIRVSVCAAHSLESACFTFCSAYQGRSLAVLLEISECPEQVLSYLGAKCNKCKFS